MLVTRTPSAIRDRRDGIKAFLDLALLAASGRGGAALHAALICNGKPGAEGLRHLRFRAFTAQEARAYLTTLLSDLLGSSHAYLLPCEAVFVHREKGGTIADAVDDLREDPWGGYSSLYGPVPHPDRFAPPPEEEALAIVERRFGPYFARLVAEEAE